MSAEDVAEAFTTHYYNQRKVGSGAENINGLFNEKSMMTFEGTQTMGGTAIVEKLRGIGPCEYIKKTTEVQAALDGASLNIFVTGGIKISGQQNPIHFSEFFCLVQTGANQYYIHNNFFRLNYGL